MKKSNQQNKWTLLGFDSQEEYFFSEWCKEAHLDFDYKPKTYILSDPVKLNQQKQRSVCPVHLLHGCEYTPDFILAPSNTFIATIRMYTDVWVDPLPESLKSVLFVSSYGKIVVDTKGEGFMSSGRSSDVRFPVLQKWMWQRHQIYVNSVVPERLFKRTFYPEAYFWTEGGKERTKKINGEFVGFGKLYKRIGDI